MEYYEELTYALKHLSVVQSFYYAGRLEAYKENCGSRIDCDEDFLYANWWELLEAAADFVDVRWDESETCERLYFSDAVIRRCLSQVQKHADNLGIRLKNDISAPAAVAAIRAAGRHVFFPAEGNRAVPAVACFNSNFRNVYEQERHLFLSLIIRRPPLFMCKKKSPGIFKRLGGFFIRFRITVPPRKR